MDETGGGRLRCVAAQAEPKPSRQLYCFRLRGVEESGYESFRMIVQSRQLDEPQRSLLILIDHMALQPAHLNQRVEGPRFKEKNVHPVSSLASRLTLDAVSPELLELLDILHLARFEPRPAVYSAGKTGLDHRSCALARVFFHAVPGTEKRVRAKNRVANLRSGETAVRSNSRRQI